MPKRFLRTPMSILLAALLASGCLGPAQKDVEVPSALAPGSPGASTVPPKARASPGDREATVPRCTHSCFEPSVAIDTEGRILAMPNSGSGMARSIDGGRTFTWIDGVPIPAGGPGNPGWDGVLSTGADGRLYYTNMWAGLESPGGITIQVASTDDAGTTWSPNVLIGPIETEHEPVGGVDRPWATAAADGTVYVSYFQTSMMVFFLPGLYQLPVWSPVAWSQNWISKSTDGGLTFDPFVPISLPTSRMSRPFDPVSGQMATDADGRVYVPFYAHDGTTAPAAYVAVSSDRGASFETVEVGPDAGGAFVTVDVDDQGGVWATWASMSGDVWLSRSSDHGATWSDPVRLNLEKPGIGTPWVVATDHVQVAWYQGSGAMFELVLASIGLGDPAAATVERRVVANVEGGANPHFPEPVPMTDYAHMAVGPDGETSLVWNDGKAERLHLATLVDRGSAP